MSYYNFFFLFEFFPVHKDAMMKGFWVLSQPHPICQLFLLIIIDVAVLFELILIGFNESMKEYRKNSRVNQWSVSNTNKGVS